MKRLQSDSSDLALAILRIVGGLLFWFHGAQKFGLFGGLGGAGTAAPIMTLIWFAGVIEVAAGLAIAGGLWTRPAAFVASGEMAVAYWTAHAPQGPWPPTNGGELAVLYCFLWLFLVFRGAGAWSIDAVINKRKAGSGARTLAADTVPRTPHRPDPRSR
jgi:putative oxidoreductase